MDNDSSPTQQQYQGYTCEAIANLVLLSMTFTANGVWSTAEGSLKCVGDDATGRQQMRCVGDGALQEGRRVEIAWINTPQRRVCSIVEAEVYDGDTCIGHAKRLQTCPAHVRQKVTIDGWEHVSEEWALLPGAGFRNGGLLLADYHGGWTGPAMLLEFGDAQTGLSAVRMWQGVMRQRVDFHRRGSSAREAER